MNFTAYHILPWLRELFAHGVSVHSPSAAGKTDTRHWWRVNEPAHEGVVSHWTPPPSPRKGQLQKAFKTQTFAGKPVTALDAAGSASFPWSHERETSSHLLLHAAGNKHLVSSSWLSDHPTRVRAAQEPLDWHVKPWSVVLQDPSAVSGGR